ncbi:GNAT family N-acetyltransferase [Chitinimonas naiadis]
MTQYSGHKALRAPSPEPMLIETDRLRLRPLAERDLATFTAYRNDPEVAHWQSFSPPYPQTAAEALFTACDAGRPFLAGEWRQIAIALRSDDTLLGDCAVYLSKDGRQGELGITLATGHQGRGYAREAFSALFDWLFERHGLHRLYASCDPANRPSARLLTRLGMRQEGHSRQSLWFKGGWADDLQFAILAEEWRQQPRFRTE